MIRIWRRRRLDVFHIKASDSLMKGKILMNSHPQGFQVMGKGVFKWILSTHTNNSIATSRKLLFLSSLMIMMIIVLLIGLHFCPEKINQVNLYLNPITNVLPLLSLIFAVLALIVAVFSYRSSNLRPHLNLRIAPLQQTGTEVQLSVDSNNCVNLCRPLNEWELALINDGEASAKYPTVVMRFELPSHEGKYFGENEFGGWKATAHAHGRGYYEFQWIPDSSVVIYPGFSIKLPTLYFQGKHFENDFVAVFSFVSDGAPISTIRLPVKVNKPV